MTDDRDNLERRLVVGVVETPDVGGILADAADSLGAWTYLAIHGANVVLAGRFIGILRALIPFVAGASRFPLRRFLPYTAIGALGG